MVSTSGERSRTRLIVEIVVGGLTAIIGAFLSWAAIVQITQLSTVFSDPCAATASCNSGALSTTIGGGIAAVGIVWVATTWLFLGRLVQRRWAFFWPLIGMVATIVLLYIVIALVGLWVSA